MMDSMQRLADRLSGKPDFHDARSRKVVLVPHCVLNQNARAAGAAERPSAVTEIVTALLEREVGVLQMPCPELCAFGLDRRHVCVEKELRVPAGRKLVRGLARDLVRQIRAYLDCGVRVLGVLGKNGSPSCGVEETWDGHVCPGSGAFIEELASELREQGIALEMTGIRDSEPEQAIAVLDRWISIQSAGKR
jgi:predicted secreted protein